MGVRDWFKRGVPAEAKERNPKVRAQSLNVASIEDSAQLAAYLRGGESDSFSGEKIGVSSALKVAAVFRCVDILSDVAGAANVSIKDKVSFVARPVDDDLVYLLNDMPNPRMNAFMLRKTMDVHRLLRGNGYARIVRGFRNRPVALEFMHSGAVEVRQLPDRSLEYTYSTPQGASVVLPQDEVLHVMGPSYDGIKGMSVLEAARNQIGYAIASERHGSALFKNRSTVGDKIMSDEDLSEEAIASLKQSLEQYRSSEGNAHGTLILQGGLKHEAVGMTQADAEFVLSRKLSIIEICMFFGVPPHIVGFTENQTSYGQGVEHQGIAFVNYKLNGVFTSWEMAIKQALLAENRLEYVEMDDSKLLRGDMKSRWEAYKIARESGVYNANDIRRMDGKPARDDDGGNEYWGQPNKAKGDGQ